jgi:hypothetical protein
VRGVVLTGSVAAENADPGADVDLMLVVAPRRLATVFLLLGSASRLVGRVFCPNYYISAEALPSSTSNPYVAREVAQARLLSGDRAAWCRATAWTREWFPNMEPAHAEEPAPCGGILQRLLERALDGAAGDRIERWGTRLALARLRAHHSLKGEVVPADVVRCLHAGFELRFHGGGLARDVAERYAAIRARVLAALEPPAAGSGGAA